MFIDVSSLVRTKGHHLDVERRETAEPCSRFQGIELEPPLHLVAHLTHVGEGEIRLTGQVEQPASGLCARCLAPVRQTFSAMLDARFLPVALVPDEEQAAGEELPTYAYRGHRLELERMLWDHLIPVIPMQFLCQEDCRGLCPHCGANRNDTDCSCHETAGAPTSPFHALHALLQEDTHGRP